MIAQISLGKTTCNLLRSGRIDWLLAAISEGETLLWESPVNENNMNHLFGIFQMILAN